MTTDRLTLSLVGAGSCGDTLYQLAFATGREVARAGAILVCGGGEGVMAAGCAGAKSVGGTTVGVLPGIDAATSPPNPHVDVAIYTGMGQARNLIVVLSGQAVIAVGGEWGTVSEIALARKHGIPVVLLESWSLQRPDATHDPFLLVAESAEDAVTQALEAARQRPPWPRR